MVLWFVKLYNQEGTGHGCQLNLTGGDGGAGQVGQLPVFAHARIANRLSNPSAGDFTQRFRRTFGTTPLSCWKNPPQ